MYRKEPGMWTTILRKAAGKVILGEGLGAGPWWVPDMDGNFFSVLKKTFPIPIPPSKPHEDNMVDAGHLLLPQFWDLRTCQAEGGSWASLQCNSGHRVADELPWWHRVPGAGMTCRHDLLGGCSGRGLWTPVTDVRHSPGEAEKERRPQQK